MASRISLKQEKELKLCLANAAARGDLTAMEQLIARGALVSQGAVVLAAANGQASAIELLLRMGKPSSKVMSIALRQAMYRQHWAIAGRLIHSGADVNSKEGLSKAPPLVLAVAHGMTDIVIDLLRAGADPNSFEAPLGADLLGIDVERTALMAAAINGHEDIVRLLLRAGADPNVKGDKGKTAYELICKRKNRSRIAALLSGASRKHKSKPAKHRRGRIGRGQKGTEMASFSSWREAVRFLSGRLNSKARPHPTAAGVTVWPLTLADAKRLIRESARKGKIDSNAFKLLVEELSAAFEAVGFSVFYSHHPRDGFLICAVPWDDKFKTVKAFKTASANWRVTHSGLLKFLRELDAEHPFRLEECSHSSVDGQFRIPLTAVKPLAKRLYEFCPFAAEDCGGKVTRLARGLQTTRRFTLWWD